MVITSKTVFAKTVKAALKTANNAYATKVTLGKNVTTIKANAFAGTDVRTLVVKTKKLSAKRVSGALRNSEVRAVKVNVKASAKKMKSIRKTYQRAFAKKNSGRKVTITFVS